jgi:uncharacterized membrane protein YgaE (UPF0421/DUF939 family)
MSTTLTTQMEKADATALTQRIRTAVHGLGKMLLEAHDHKAWKALGYKTWSAYVEGEFDMGRAHSYRLLDHGRVIKAIEDATGKVSPMGDISERTARELKDDLPAATAEIAARSEQGEEPAQSAKEIAAERKAAKVKAVAEKKERQAELDRQRDEHRAKLPDTVKQAQTAKEVAIETRKAKPEEGLSDADRIEELEEAVKGLEDENAALRAENKLYGDMKVQWEAGDYEAVIAGKDEEIRVLESRLFRESADKASCARSAEYWKEQAKKLGWSNKATINIETGEVTNG